MTPILEKIAEQLQTCAYSVGTQCTWHGPTATAGLTSGAPDFTGETQGVTFSHACPHCDGPLRTMPREEFFAQVDALARQTGSDYGQMLRWSEGKCFPDVETLTNAWRQAAEE